MVSKCQGNCGEKIPTSDKEDFLLVKSFGQIQFTLKGEKHTKYGPLYIHFKNDCLKEFSRRIHENEYEKFPYGLIKIDEAVSYTHLTLPTIYSV